MLTGLFPLGFVALHEAIGIAGKRLIPGWTGQELDGAVLRWNEPLLDEPSSYDPGRSKRLPVASERYATPYEAERAAMQTRFKGAALALLPMTSSHRLLVLAVRPGAILTGEAVDEALALEHFIGGGGGGLVYAVHRAQFATLLDDITPKRRGRKKGYPGVPMTTEAIVALIAFNERKTNPTVKLAPFLRETAEQCGVWPSSTIRQEKLVQRLRRRVDRHLSGSGT